MVACGGDDASQSAGGGALPDDDDPVIPIPSCAVDERPTVAGACVPVGITAEDCAAGFSFEPSVGCLPVLPDAICPPGEMAIPGDEACRPVAPCGAGRWPEPLPTENVIFVDASAELGGDGTMALPFIALAEAVAAAPDGATVAIAAGSYDALRVEGKALHFVGRCPSMVELVAESGDGGALLFRAGSDTSSARGLALTGEGVGLGVSDVAGVVVEQLWVHDTSSDGVVASDQLGWAELELRDSLVEQTGSSGVTVGSVPLRLLRSEVRDAATAPNAGVGIRVLPSGFTPTSGPASLTIEDSWIHRAVYAALLVEASTVVMRRSVVSDVIPDATGSALGVFSQLDASAMDPRPATVVVHQSAVLRTTDVAMLGLGVEMDVDRVTVADVAPIADGTFGRGVEVVLPQSVLRLTNSSVVDVHEAAVAVIGAEAQIDDLSVRDVTVVAGRSRGLSLQEADSEIAPGRVHVARSSFEGIAELGVMAFNLEGFEMEEVAITGVHAPEGVAFGDGVVVIDGRGAPAPYSIARTLVERSSRAGLGAFGPELSLEGCRFSCNAIQLNGETFSERSATISDLGGNLCECDGIVEGCKILSSGLEPPQAL